MAFNAQRQKKRRIRGVVTITGVQASSQLFAGRLLHDLFEVGTLF